MSIFWELFKDNVIVQGLIALILISAMVYMYVNNTPPPEIFVNIVILIIGHYFGSKNQLMAYRKVQSNENTVDKHTD